MSGSGGQLLWRLPEELVDSVVAALRRPKLLAASLLAAYLARCWRHRAKVQKLPSHPDQQSFFFWGDLGHVMYVLPIVPKTGSPDFLTFCQDGAERTRKQGLMCMRIFSWWVPCSANVVVVHDIKMVRSILDKSSYGIYRKGRSYRVTQDLLGTRGLLASPDNDSWRWQRRLLSPAFRRHLFDQVLAPAVQRLVGELSSSWERQALEAGGARPKVDFSAESLRLTLSALGAFAFGDGSAGFRSGEIPLEEAFSHVLRRTTEFGRNPLLFMTRWLPTANNQRYWQAMKCIKSTVTAGIDSRIAKGDLGDDLLGHVLRASLEDSQRMDKDLLLENLQTFLFAGHDTTASALCWSLYLLAEHPEEVAHLRREFSSLHESAQGLVSCDDLDTLPRLEAVLREVLRLYPSAGFTREPVQDVELGGHRIPRGTEILIVPYIVHRNESLFPDCKSFRPSRWLTAGGALKGGAPESQGWLPFSLGLRNCIGSQLARLELKLMIRELLNRYDFKAPSDAEGPPQAAIFMTVVPSYLDLIPIPRKC